MSMADGFHKKLVVAGILWMIVIIFAGCKVPGAGPSGHPDGQKSKVSLKNQKGKWVTVARVVDGDTFLTTDRVRVRLTGVDTPESTKRHEPYGREAAAFTKSRLEGQKVRLEYDVDRKDKYGRTLAYVYLEDRTFFNALLVAEGYAQIMTVPPNVKYAEKFLDLQRKARAQNKGLWGLKE